MCEKVKHCTASLANVLCCTQSGEFPVIFGNMGRMTVESRHLFRPGRELTTDITAGKVHNDRDLTSTMGMMVVKCQNFLFLRVYQKSGYGKTLRGNMS